jgi:hypothetical protein
MKLLINLKENSNGNSLDSILRNNINSYEIYNDNSKLVGYVIWLYQLNDKGWCFCSKMNSEDDTLSDLVKTMDKIIIDLSSEHLNKLKSNYIRDIKLSLLND